MVASYGEEEEEKKVSTGQNCGVGVSQNNYYVPDVWRGAGLKITNTSRMRSVWWTRFKHFAEQAMWKERATKTKHPGPMKHGASEKTHRQHAMCGEGSY